MVLKDRHTGILMQVMENIFYELIDPTENVPEADEIWEFRLKENKIVCDYCGNFLKRSPIDIYLKEKISKSFAPITVATSTKVGMIRKDVVTLIGLCLLEKAYHLGNVYGKDQKLSEEYISLVPKSEAYVRGEEESICKLCDKCGTILYFPLPQGKEYLTPDQVLNEELFPSYGMGIIVNENILRNIKKSGIKKIGIYSKLEIKEKAIDGNDLIFNNIDNALFNGDVPSYHK